MKKTYIILTLIMFYTMSSRAQQCFGNNGCGTDGTSTGVTQPCPTTNDFHKNTFDWTQSTIRSIDKSDFHAFAPYVPGNPLVNPYYTPGPDPYIAHIAQGAGSDFYPADGWELIKQDFGYFYDANTNKWDGTSIASSTSSTNIGNTSIAYFILYNKYTGIMRIFADFPFSGGIEYSNIEVTINFMSSTTGDPTSANYVNFKPSALFNAYNNNMLPLDQVTKAIAATSWAKMVTDKSHFCYADFQLSYDPCTCFFNQGLQVTFRGVQKASLSIIGRYEGVGTNDPALLNVGTGQDNLYGQNQLDTFLTSVLNNDPAHPRSSDFTQSNIIAFEKYTSNLAQEISQQYINNQNVQNIKNVLNVAFTVWQAGSGLLSGGISSSGSSNPTPIDQIAKYTKDAFGMAASTVNLFNTGLSPGTQSTIMWGSVALTGTSYIADDLNGIGFAIATPGSAMGATASDQMAITTPPCPSGCDPANAYNMPEYGGAVLGGQWPDAPIYNEVPGLFALKSTPTVNRFISDPATLSQSLTHVTLPDGTQTILEQYTNRNIEYQFDLKSLNVLYSPYVNASTTQIYAALEIEGIPQPINITGTDFTGNNFTVPSYILDAATNMTEITGTVHGISTTNRTYMTDFVPISCLGQVITQEKFDLNGVGLTESQFFSGLLDGSGATHVGTTSAQPFSLINQKVTLVLQIYYEFKQNNYGKTKRTFQILKFPININNVTSALSTQSQFSALANLPNNLTLNSLPSTLPTNGIIYSRGTINITGDLTLPANTNPITITASQDIIVNPGVNIGPGITLEVSSLLPICDNFSSATVTPATVDHTFCTGSSYQANQSSSKTNYVAQQPPAQSPNTYNFNFNLYPNPAGSECTVRFEMVQAADVTITLTDMMGAEVATIDHSRHQTGTSFVPFNTSGYAPGLYLVRFSDGTNTVTQKLAISGSK